MQGYLLDTNVISEPLKPVPNPSVVAWLDSLSPATLYLSVLTMGEIRKGVEKKTQGKRREQLVHWLEKDLPQWFDGRILPIDAAVAECWGAILAQSARPQPAIDSLIAATCLTHGLTLATRNERDFNWVGGLMVVNPWG